MNAKQIIQESIKRAQVERDIERLSDAFVTHYTKRGNEQHRKKAMALFVIAMAKAGCFKKEAGATQQAGRGIAHMRQMLSALGKKLGVTSGATSTEMKKMLAFGGTPKGIARVTPGQFDTARQAHQAPNRLFGLMGPSAGGRRQADKAMMEALRGASSLNTAGAQKSLGRMGQMGLGVGLPAVGAGGLALGAAGSEPAFDYAKYAADTVAEAQKPKPAPTPAPPTPAPTPAPSPELEEAIATSPTTRLQQAGEHLNKAVLPIFQQARSMGGSPTAQHLERFTRNTARDIGEGLSPVSDFAGEALHGMNRGIKRVTRGIGSAVRDATDVPIIPHLKRLTRGIGNQWSHFGDVNRLTPAGPSPLNLQGNKAMTFPMSSDPRQKAGPTPAQQRQNQ